MEHSEKKFSPRKVIDLFVDAYSSFKFSRAQPYDDKFRWGWAAWATFFRKFCWVWTRNRFCRSLAKAMHYALEKKYKVV